MNVQKSLGRWILYSLCLAPAVVMLGYYGLEYIPRQRDYFMDLRFRALAKIGDQVRTKVDSLLTALDYATKFDGQSAKYIAALVPDLRYTQECGDSPNPRVQFGATEDTVRFKSKQGCAAVAALSKVFAQSTSDDLFDDVIIADSSGRVVYQRSPGSPRIVALGDLKKASPDTKTASGESAGANADNVRYTRFGDSEFALLMQPLRISSTNLPDQTLVVCGLVRSQRLAEEARHVPPLYLLAIFAPLLIVFLSGPFLKILLLTRTGRLAFRDLALLSACAVITAGLLTLLLTSWRVYWTGGGQSELEQFAHSLNHHLVCDIKLMQRTLAQLDEERTSNIRRPLTDQTDILASNQAKMPPVESAPFDFVFWTDEDGCQVAKWTTKVINTGRVDQSSQQHFRDLRAKRFWSIDGNPFTLQTLISPTTSQLIVVMGMAADGPGRKAPCGQAPADSGKAQKASRIIESAIVGLLPSVSSTLMPPGAGFAIIDPRGEVIFHSSPERDLHENLFDEIRSPSPWRAAVAMGIERSGCAYYRGRKYQFYMQPVTGIAGSSWNIATFRELEPRQAMIGMVWSETLALFLAPLCLLAVALVLLSAALRVQMRQTWRQQVDFVLIRFWPDAARAPVFLRLAKELAVLTLLSLLVVILGSAHAYRSAGWLLPFCYVAPAAAITLSVFRLRKSDPASWNRVPSGQRQPAYIACVSLLLVLLAVVPTLGLFSICDAFENRLYLMRWQRELVNSWNARRTRIQANINGSPAFSDNARRLVLDRFSSREKLSGWSGRDYIKHFWGTELSTEPEARNKVDAVPDWWQTLVASIRPETEQAGAAEAGALAGSLTESSPCQWRTAPGSSRLILICRSGPAPVEVASTLPATGVGLDPPWWVALLVLLGGAYAWNCRALCRLFLQDFDYSPLPFLPALPAPAAMQSDVLLLGLPLARKDEAVRQWLGHAPPRVNLYAAHLSESWLAETITRVQRELTASPALAAQAAAGGTTTQLAPTVSRTRWVHISNLEAKLSEPRDRQIVAGLVENLIAMNIGGARPRLIVTSTIDPVFHFDSVLTDERKKIYEHPLAEPELQRISRLLYNFRKAQAPGPADQPPEWATRDDAGAAVYEECRHHQALLAVGEEVASSAALTPRHEALLARIAERAQALYKLFWACCARSEKLLLIQLAQTGLVNPLCLDTLQALVRKGLILPGSRPRIMNETFLRFLTAAEAPATVHQWESEAGESSWPVIRNVVLVLIAAGLVVVAMTQREAMQTVTAVLTGVGTVMAVLFRLAGYFGGHREPPAEES